MKNDRYRDIAILAALAVAMLAQMWMSDLHLSVTSDEIDHLHAGYRYLTCHDFGWNPEHPPLVKMVAALPLLFMHINDPIGGACGLANNRGIDFHAGHDFVFANNPSMLTAARFVTSIFALALLLITWLFARKLFGPAVASIAAVLIAFEPTILGHGSLVTTDVPAAFGFVLVAYATYWYTENPNWLRALCLGLSVGLALSLKYSAVLLAVILPLLLITDCLLCDKVRRIPQLRLHTVALVIVLAMTVVSLWAVYGFHYSGRPADVAIWPTEKQWPNVHGVLSTQLVPLLIKNRVLPQPYLVGLRDVAIDSEVGRPGFLLGRTYHGGNWAYFPIATTIKFTLPFLGLLAISVFRYRFWQERVRELLFTLIPAAVVLAVAMASGVNIGFRHVMPIVPFLAIFAAIGARFLVNAGSWQRIAVIGILLFHAGSSLHSFPNYLSYSNEAWGGPTNTYKYLADSNADWGQAQKMAREYILRAHPESCFYIQAYNARSSDYGIPCGSITEMEDEVPPEIFTGTLIVSSSVVDGITGFTGEARVRRLFHSLNPTAELGGSALLVYSGTFDLRPLVSATLVRRNVDPRFTSREKTQRARQAAEIDPNNPDAYMILCHWSKQAGDLTAAQRECNTGLHLILSDPDSTTYTRHKAFGYLASLGITVDAANKTLADTERPALRAPN